MMKECLLPIEFPCLVALSGGMDSRVLLELAVQTAVARYPEEPPSRRVAAVHVNHGIRGEEADRDEAFCRQVCTSLDVPLVVEHIDVPAIARETGESEETAARRVRYDCFIRTMQARQIPLLLTAHHADDQLETILYHLLRGSGTKGMGGIPKSRLLGETLPDGTPLMVARPLLSWTRADIAAALHDMGADCVTDSTNLTDTCTRNRLRHHVTPLLEEITGAGIPQRAAVRLGQAAREDDEALTAIAASRYAAACRDRTGLPAASVKEEMPAVAKRMIRLAYAAYIGGNSTRECISEDTVPAARTLSARHLEDLCTLCKNGVEGDVSDALPSGVRGEIRGGCLVFAPIRPARPTDLGSSIRAVYEGDTLWGAGDAPSPSIWIRVETGTAPLPPLTVGETVDRKTVFASAVFPADQLPLPLWARIRRAGDVIQSHGMTKKLKKILCDKHIPLSIRDRLPLFCVCDPAILLWFPGAAFRDGYVAPDEGPVLRVTILLETGIAPTSIQPKYH